MSATLAAAVLATTVRVVASHAYAEGAPPGFSGGFKEESCHACHFHEALNAGGGRVTIDGVPPKFAAGARYTLTVTLTRSGMKRAGFQLAARFTDSGAPAGTLAPAADEGERVKVESQGGVQYAGQKKAGSSVSAADSVRWTIEWTAPDRGGPVVFHVSANAADGNESADGDFVYTATAESRPPAFAHASLPVKRELRLGRPVSALNPREGCPPLRARILRDGGPSLAASFGWQATLQTSCRSLHRVFGERALQLGERVRPFRCVDSTVVDGDARVAWRSRTTKEGRPADRNVPEGSVSPCAFSLAAIFSRPHKASP